MREIHGIMGTNENGRDQSILIRDGRQAVFIDIGSGYVQMLTADEAKWLSGLLAEAAHRLEDRLRIKPPLEGGPEPQIK
jgi:hypothetical protein